MRTNRGSLLIAVLAVVLGMLGVAETQAVYVKTTETRLTFTTANQSGAAVYEDVTVYVDTGSGAGDILWMDRARFGRPDLRRSGCSREARRGR